MTAHVARRVAAFVTAPLVLMMLALSVTSAARAATPTVTGAETDLGVQVPGQLSGLRSEGSAQGVAPDGRYLTYFVNNGTGGQLARFFAMDLTGRLVAEINVPQGTSINGVAYSATSKTVFFAANSATYAFLYEWTGTQLVKRASISGHAVLRLAAAPDGGVYMGSFAPSNGRLFRYVSGTLTDLGQPAAGESYVRSLAVDTSAVWVSNYRESAAKLIRVDRATKARTVVTTPSTFASQWSGFDMTRAGNFLFLRTVNDPRLFAYDTVNKRFATFNDQVARVRTSPEVANPQPYISGISPYGISPLFGGKFVYFQRSGAGIMRVDLTNGLKAIRVDKWDGTDNTTPWPSATVAGPVSYAWLSGVAGRSGYSLVATTIDAKVYVNGPGQSAPTILTLPARGAPSTINRLGLTADGKVLSGGFNLPTGVGVHDPSSHAQSLLTGPQIEGFGRFDSSTVLGGYTGNSSASAPIYLYSGSGEPQLKVYLNNSQERPVALVQVGRRIAIGSVPIKNTLGGALSLWDPATNALTVKRGLIPNHSIISLAARGNLVIGGSSNVGGTGSTPTATAGQLFTYDTTTGALKTFTPPRAASATYSWVAAITADPAEPDHYWAISTGYLIQFKVAADGTITLTRNLGAFPNTSSPTGKELGIAFVDDAIFATVGGGLAAINRATGEQTVIAATTSVGAVSGLVRDAGSRLFYARGTRLYTYQVDSATATATLEAPQVTAPGMSTAVEPGAVVFQGTGTKNASLTVTDGSRSRSTVVRDDGTWTLAPMDFSSGSFRLTFAASLSGLPTKTTEVSLLVGSASAQSCTFVAPAVTNLNENGYNAPNTDYAFQGTGTPGTTVTMVSGTRTRVATVRDDGTWNMNPVYFGWWAGTVPFTASFPGCDSRTKEVSAWFVDKPTSHVQPLMISHTQTDWYSSGEVAFKGKGTPGALVTLEMGNQTRFAAVSTTGRWSMRAVTVGDAPVCLTLRSEVPDLPEKVATADVHVGTAPVTVTAPAVTGPAAGSSVPAGSVQISGTGTPATKISLSVNGQDVSAFVRSSGRWTLPPVTLQAGRWDLAPVASSPGLSSVSSSATVAVG